MSRKNNLTAWRELLELSQQSLADFLDITRSQLNMIERGERALPTQALLQFNELVLAYEQAKAMPQPAEWLTQERAEKIEVLRQKLEDLDWEIQKKQREYDALSEAYNRLKLQMQTLRLLRLNFKDDSQASKGKNLWLDIQSYESEKKFKQSAFKNIARLQIELESLKQTQIAVSKEIAQLEAV